MQRYCARVMLAGLAAWGCLALVQAASAQVPSVPAAVPATPAAQNTTDARIEMLEKQLQMLKQQNDQLMKTVQSLNPQTGTVGASADQGADKDAIEKAVNKALDDAAKKAADKKKADDEAKKATDAVAKEAAKHKWYEVGTDLKLEAKWYDGFYVQTANKDFWMHIGGWEMNDYYWWHQSPSLIGKFPATASKFKPGIQGPSPTTIGDLEDGDIWRRLRLQFEGGFWEVFEFNLVPAFENDQFGTIGLDEFWFGISKIPIIGNIRVGHVKLEHNLEADGISSSRTFTFFERSSMADAFYPNFGTGLWIFNSFLDDRVTVGGNLFRQDVPAQNGSVSGDSFGDGQYAWDARVTCLPWYSNNGRCLVHLGASYSWYSSLEQFTIDGNASDPTGQRLIRFRARPEMRDADPAGDFTDTSSGNNLFGNKNRLVDTGNITSSSWDTVGLEFLTILGPFSVQAEYCWATVNNPILTGVPGFPKGKSVGDATFNGGYIQLAYTLTGENRSYDKRLGRLDSYYYGRQGPYTPFWIVRNPDGTLNRGLGAWEIACRYSYLDLNDGPFQGGKEGGLSAGVNWALNNNMRIQCMYQWNNRYDLPVGTTTATSPVAGQVNGVGVRFNLIF